MIEIPYNVETREETGLYNAKLGVWIFLASEIMLFGGLFSLQSDKMDLYIENNDIILKGPKQAVVFKKDENIFEINSGFNLKNLI